MNDFSTPSFFGTELLSLFIKSNPRHIDAYSNLTVLFGSLASTPLYGVYAFTACTLSTGQIAVDKFGRNSVRSSIIVDYNEKAVANIVAPLFAAKTEHLYPMPSATSNLRNMQCAAGMQVEGSNKFCLRGSGDPSTHGPVGEFCGTTCKECPASTYSPEAGVLDCIVCPKNTFSNAAKTKECTRCSLGQSTDGKTGATSCQPCASGTYNDEAGKDCRACPPGSYSFHNPGEAAGASECIKCKDLPGSFYQPLGSQDKCLQCPENTENSGSSGTDINDCVCMLGFWRPDGRSGSACVKCPDGATCAGGHQMKQPVSQDGYWVPTHQNGTVHGFPFALSNESNTLPDIFFRCPNSDACRANNTCDDEHNKDSKMCLQCAPGLHNMLGWCIGCPGGALLTVIEWILVVLLWQGIQAMSKVYPTLDMLLMYAQCLSIIQGFNVPWPQVNLLFCCVHCPPRAIANVTVTVKY